MFFPILPDFTGQLPPGEGGAGLGKGWEWTVVNPLRDLWGEFITKQKTKDYNAMIYQQLYGRTPYQAVQTMTRMPVSTLGMPFKITATPKIMQPMQMSQMMRTSSQTMRTPSQMMRTQTTPQPNYLGEVSQRAFSGVQGLTPIKTAAMFKTKQRNIPMETHRKMPSMQNTKAVEHMKRYVPKEHMKTHTVSHTHKTVSNIMKRLKR